MKKIVVLLSIFLAVGVGFYGIAYIPFSLELYFTQFSDVYHRIFLIIHAGCGGAALLLGFWQFNNAWRKNHRTLFRRCGILYTWLVLIAALSGFYVAYHADVAQFSGKIGFISLGVVWLYTLYKGYYYVRKRNFLQRRLWFMRNYALTLSAVILRIELGVFMLLGVDFNTFYPVLAWISWVPSLLVLEYYYMQKFVLKS